MKARCVSCEAGTQFVNILINFVLQTMPLDVHFALYQMDERVRSGDLHTKSCFFLRMLQRVTGVIHMFNNAVSTIIAHPE
jgi:hypothetical protein